MTDRHALHIIPAPPVGPARRSPIRPPRSGDDPVAPAPAARSRRAAPEPVAPEDAGHDGRDGYDEDEDALTDLLPGGDRDGPDDPDDPDGPDDGWPGGPGGDGGGGRGRGGEDFGVGGRRPRRWLWPAVIGVLVVALLGGAFLARGLFGVVAPPDFSGPGTGDVVVQVGDGDSMGTVGAELAAKGVVASARAFGAAAEDDPRGRGVSPGYYTLKRQMSAKGALDALLDPASRLGRVEIRGGAQLDDTKGAGDAVVPGVLSQIARATCAPDPSGTPVCRTRDELEQAMTSTDPAALGVPAWAVADVAKAEPRRRLEGLIVPGVYDIPPGSSARDALTRVVRASAEELAAAGLVGRPGPDGLTPYQVLVVASIAEKEGVEQDFAKITRVIDNRLPVPMRLQMDSTINYPLDKQTLLTTPADRAAPGPYNTYVNFGLTPTPIGAPSPEAVRAAVAPEPGPWVYFVKCEPDGTSCFAVTQEEHDANRRLAQERGAY